MVHSERNDPCPCGAKKPDGTPKKYKHCCLKRDETQSRINLGTHLKIQNIRINGIATNNVMAGEEAWILTRAEITSDQPEFYTIMKNVSHLVTDRAQKTGAHVSLDRAAALLLVTHEDGTADLYIHDVPMTMEILAKHDVAAGDVVYRSGIADVRRVRLPGVELAPTDGVMFCWKIGWKFALFFDLTPNRTLDIDAMERSLGKLYRHLSFEEMYAALGDPDLFTKLIQAGWFPFVEIVGGELDKLFNAHRMNFNIEAEEQELLKKFDASRIDAIGERWWKRPCLADRRAILEPALEAFKRKDSVSTLKIILTEIEGIIQAAHITDAGSGASIKDLLAYASEKGIKKTGDETSLLFPKEFLKYLSDYTYARFDSKKPEGDVMSRHSAGHGGARAEAYTQVRALQAILTLDQLSFYL